MPYYVDTSAFLKLVVAEEHSAAFRSWAERQEGDLFGSDLLRTESLRIARMHSSAILHEARARLAAITLLTMTPDVFDRAALLDPRILRTLDALHLASALALGEELEGVATYDRRLAEAVDLHGIQVVHPTDSS